MLHTGGQNQHDPTNGQIGDTTLAVRGSPNTSRRGTKPTVAYKWAAWPLGELFFGAQVSSQKVVDRLAYIFKWCFSTLHLCHKKKRPTSTKWQLKPNTTHHPAPSPALNPFITAPALHRRWAGPLHSVQKGVHFVDLVPPRWTGNMHIQHGVADGNMDQHQPPPPQTPPTHMHQQL